MEARFFRAVALTAVFASLGASYRSANFVVTAPSPDAAQQIGQAAEQYRRELSVLWLGKEMPNWSQPCPITAHVGQQLGAGGATSFLFEGGEVFGWRMTIQGSLERILDSVLPHEVTHTIFASHFRRPLPRWADEGACTTVEHASERAKQQTMLVDFLRTGRGISFSRMFAMTEYPHDVMPLYSQGYSLARYLIAQGGRQKFLTFLRDGLADDNWTRAINKYYGYSGLATLQNSWLEWVRSGSPNVETAPGTPTTLAGLAQNDRRQRPEPNLIYRGQSIDPPTSQTLVALNAAEGARPAPASNDASSEVQSGYPRSSAGWHPRSTGEQAAALAARDSAETSSAPKQYAATRPQPVERSRQIILEWSRPAGSAVSR